MTIKDQVWLADAIAGSAMLFALYFILREKFAKTRLPQAAERPRGVVPQSHGGDTDGEVQSSPTPPFGKNFAGSFPVTCPSLLLGEGCVR